MKKTLLLCVAIMQLTQLTAMEQQEIQCLVQHRTGQMKLQYEARLQAARQENTNQIVLLRQQDIELQQLRARLAEFEKTQSSNQQQNRLVSLAKWMMYEHYAQMAVAVVVGFAGGMWWSSGQPKNEKKQDQK